MQTFKNGYRNMVSTDRKPAAGSTLTYGDKTLVCTGTGTSFSTPMDAWNLPGDVNPNDDYVCYAYYDIQTAPVEPEIELPAPNAAAIESHLTDSRGLNTIGKIRTHGWGPVTAPAVYAQRGMAIYDAIVPIVGSDNYSHDKDRAYARFSIPREFIPVVAEAIQKFA